MAIRGVILSLLVLGVVAEIQTLFAYLAADPRPSAVTAAKFGGFTLYTFHHVATRGVIRSGASEFPINGGVTFVFAAMTGTLLVLWLLYRNGRAVAQDVGGPALARALNGAKIAVPYALVLFGLSWIVRFSQTEEGVGVSIHPSYLSALLWPLGLALVAGAAGGIGSERAGAWRDVPWARRARAAVAGGGAMLGVGLALAFVGLMIMAPIKPHATAVYFRPFGEKFAGGMTLVYATLLFVPNMAAFVLFPAMGSCLSASANAVGFSLSFCLLSYSQFPTSTGLQQGGTTAPNLPGPAGGYFLFVLVPLVAVVAGGVVAARRAGSTSRQEAVGTGALAGVAFALFALFAAFLASISAKVSGIPQIGNASARVGPALVSTFLLALLWGVVGGGLGALWEGRSLPMRVPAPAPAAPEPWGQPPPPESSPGPPG